MATAIKLTEDDASNRPQFEMDADVFLRAVDDAAAACRAIGQLPRFRPQLLKVFKRLSHWRAEHTNRVALAVIGRRGDELLFLTVQKHPGVDEELIDSLTRLEQSVAQDSDLDLIRLGTLAVRPLPADEAVRMMASEPYAVF